MDLIERFEDADDKEWVIVEANLPESASRCFIIGELGFMAEDLVTQIGYAETESGLKLGFRTEAIRDQVLGLLEPVVEEASQLSDKSAMSILWGRNIGRAGISLLNDGTVYPHSYVETIDPTRE